MNFKTHRKITLLALFLAPAIFPLANSIAHAAPKPKVANPKIASKASLNDALFDAILQNDLPAVQNVLARGADVNARDNSGNTPLMYAAPAGHTAIVAFLLQNGAKVDAKDTMMGATALWQAAEAGQIETARLLLQAGADANASDSERTTVLSEAIMINMGREDTAFVELLLDHGANPHPDIQQFGSPLASAAGFGERKVVELLFARGADTHAADGTLISALVGVLINGNMMIVRMGLYGYAATLSDKQKADIISQTEANDTAIVKDLLDHGVDVSTFPNNKVLTFAAADGIAPIVRMLLDKGAPVNGSTIAEAKAAAKTHSQGEYLLSQLATEIAPNNITPLMAAAAGGHADVCQMLLDAGANPNLKDTGGQTALMHVVRSGRNQIAHDLPHMREEVLHRADEGAEKPTSREVKPAEAAAMQKWADEGDIAIIKALLAKNADLQAHDNQERTALMMAAANSSPAVVQTLVAAGASINAQDASGQNALMHVVENGQISRAPQLFSFELQESVQVINKDSAMLTTAAEKAMAAQTKAAAAKQKSTVINAAIAQDSAVVKILLAAGINLNAKDKKGQTALQMARKTHHAAIVTLLEQAAVKTGH